MTTQNDPADEAAVREMFAACREAVAARDVKRLMGYYTASLVAFDAIGPLQFTDRAAYDTHWRSCLEMCAGQMVFDMQDLSLTLGEDVGFGHYLVYCGATDPEGKTQAGWMRCSIGLRKVDGQWRIAHEHFSVPFEPETCKAQFELTP
ncbi:YybH family protein [Denitromonas halophila]|uniref:DUF4440 domain-containing protein n=1 Tax=Denitromonas halophila TaxID=1629404 RepID=A0A557R0B4_9RHOO|nr:nuclear transport factor 2 family protein [Denitromonas halophila]TVO58601.1 DUF4440 domain-containing protein [Denitromonas halophila]